MFRRSSLVAYGDKRQIFHGFLWNAGFPLNIKVIGIVMEKCGVAIIIWMA